jgi:hypothetical protein
MSATVMPSAAPMRAKVKTRRPDQRLVTQAADSSGVDAVQELARFERTQYRGLASVNAG